MAETSRAVSGTDVSGQMNQMMSLLQSMEQRMERLESRSEPRHRVEVGPDLELLDPRKWQAVQVCSDIQRQALWVRVRKYFLGKATDDNRKWDVRQGDCLLRVAEKHLAACVADNGVTKSWSRSQMNVMTSIFEELLSLKILAEFSSPCQDTS